MAKLGAKKTASTHEAPTRACGQSTTSTRPSGVSSRLSARKSRWSRVFPVAAAGASASRPASLSRWRADQTSRLAGLSSTNLRQCHPQITSQSPTTPTRPGGSGDGVRNTERDAMASRVRSSSLDLHGTTGFLPSTSSKISTIQPPRPRRGKTGTWARAHPRAARRQPLPPCGGPRASAGWAQVQQPPWRRSDARLRSGAARPHQVRTQQTARPPIQQDCLAGSPQPRARVPECLTTRTGGQPRPEVWTLSPCSPILRTQNPLIGFRTTRRMVLNGVFLDRRCALRHHLACHRRTALCPTP
jgi:hypothetical protein